MEYEGHGGSCCGYGHIYNMDHTSVEGFREGLEEHRTAAAGVNRIVEVILSERQVSPLTAWERGQIHDSVTAAGGWPAVLAAEGFRLAAEWRNSNTGNNCYQFIHIPTLLTDAAGYNRTFRWEAGIIPAVGVAPIPVPVVPGVPERYQGVHPQPPAGPVDHTLPILVWDNRTSMYYPVTQVRSRDVGGETRIYASGSGRGCTLTGDIWYSATTGRLGGSFHRGQLVNYVPDAPAAPVPAPIPAPAAPVAAPAPQTRFTEFYANLRVSGRRGPFETAEAAREAYPRCRNMEQRQILTDGSSLWTPMDARLV